MKAVLIQENKDLLWTDVPDPVIGEDEVLVKIYAAALNRADLLQRAGTYPSPPGCPEWMGLEIAGVVAEVGSAVTNWKVGDKVCALLGGGGYAELVAVKHDMLMPVPKGLSLVEASALPEAYATSYLNLFLEGHLQPGQTAFIHFARHLWVFKYFCAAVRQTDNPCPSPCPSGVVKAWRKNSRYLSFFSALGLIAAYRVISAVMASSDPYCGQGAPSSSGETVSCGAVTYRAYSDRMSSLTGTSFCVGSADQTPERRSASYNVLPMSVSGSAVRIWGSSNRKGR